MRKFFPKRKPTLSKRKRLKRGLKAACLSLTLTTAWGGEAAADATLKVEITPEQALTNALVFYGNNVSSGILRSLGTIPAGSTTVIYHTIVSDEVGIEGTWSWEPESYEPAGGNQVAVYAVIGLYDGAAGQGVAVSFQNDDVIEEMASWSSIFEREDQNSDYRYSEASIISYLQQIEFFAPHPQVVKEPEIRRFLELYSQDKRPYLHGELATPYGQNATLVNFSDATFGGTVVAALVPEPASWCLLMSAAGVVFYRRPRS